MEIVRRILRLLFWLATIVLVVVFIIRILSPGTSATAPLFATWALIQPFMDSTANWLCQPITLLVSLLEPFLPPQARTWFPISPAAPLFDGIRDLLLRLPGLSDTGLGRSIQAIPMAQWVPGVFDWRLPLTLGLLAWVEDKLNDILNWLARSRNRRHQQKFEREMTRLSQPLPTQPESQESTTLSAPPPVQHYSHENAGLTRSLRQEIAALQAPDSLDPLTRLLNRNDFMDRLSRAMGQARHTGGTLALLMLDIDDFNQLNTRYGKQTGDDVLILVALAAAQVSPRTGTASACRYGGEEILVLLAGTDSQEALRVADVLLEQIRLIRLPEQPALRVTASLGIHTVRFTEANGSFELSESAFVAKADANLYKAKRTGKDQVIASALS